MVFGANPRRWLMVSKVQPCDAKNSASSITASILGVGSPSMKRGGFGWLSVIIFGFFESFGETVKVANAKEGQPNTGDGEQGEQAVSGHGVDPSQ